MRGDGSPGLLGMTGKEGKKTQGVWFQWVIKVEWGDSGQKVCISRASSSFLEKV